MLFVLVREEELLGYHQLSDRVLTSIELLEGGVRCHLILQFIVGMTHKNIVDHVHVGFIHIFLPQFLTDDLVDVIIF